MIRHRLGNGLTVISRPQRALPLLTLDMWVRVGSGDEPRELAGASHFLEHMLFKGTPSLPVGEYDRRIEGLGGYLNAATSYDYTHYYIEVPSDCLDAALADFADVLQHSEISDAEVDSERQVILEEIRRKNDDPSGFLYDNIVRAAVEEGAYSHPVIGYSESVSGFTGGQLRDHYRRFYAADNMALVVSGDFDPGSLLPRLESLFCDLPSGARPHRAGAPATRFAPASTRSWPRDWKETYFYLTFPAPAVATLEEEVANDLASVILSGGRASRLVSSLRERQRLVSSISAYFPSHRHESLALVGGRCSRENLEPACDAAFVEIEALLADGLRPGELERARRQLINGHVYALESNSDAAGVLGYSHILLGDSSMYDRYVEVARTMDPARALERVRSVLQRDRSSLCFTGPEGGAA